MPSPFIEPFLLELATSRNGVATRWQLRKNLLAEGYSEIGLSAKVGKAVESLLDEPGSEFRAFSTQAHPGAVDSWGLLWRSSQEAPTDKPESIFHILYDNWRYANHPCEVQIICHESIRESFVKKTVDQELDSRRRTGLILRASVWFELLKTDTTAAKSWQHIENIDPTGNFDFYSATYRRKDGVNVIAVIPVPGWWGDTAFRQLINKEELSRDLNPLCQFAEERDSLLEIYSLSFPSCSWIGRPSKPKKRRRK